MTMQSAAALCHPTLATPAAPAFGHIAGAAAIAAGVLGLLYAVAFVVVSRTAPVLGGLLSAIFLLLGGIASTVALLGLYQRVRAAEPGLATVGLIFAIAGAMGALVHGGYDLANVLHPPATSNLDLPSAADPRGLLTFGMAGLAILILSGLMRSSHGFSRALAYLGWVLGSLLVIVYLGRLIVLDATSPLVLLPAVVTGFAVNPVWNVWLGVSLWRGIGASQ